MAGAVAYFSAHDILADVNTLLVGLSYPSHADTGRTPPVYFMGTLTDSDSNVVSTTPPDEHINLTGRFTVENEWVTNVHQQEVYEIEWEIVSAVDGQTGPESLTRVGAISDVIEAGFRDQTSGKPTGLSDSRVIESYRISGAVLEPVPHESGVGLVYRQTLRVITRR